MLRNPNVCRLQGTRATNIGKARKSIWSIAVSHRKLVNSAKNGKSKYAPLQSNPGISVDKYLTCLQCDLKLQCGQCIRARLKCPGPRSSKELVFRDQSKETVRKAAGRARKQLPRSVTVPVIDRARDLFFARYVYCQARTYDYLLGFDLSTNDAPHLVATLDAVSLAYLSTQIHDEGIMTKARERYATSLQLTSAAVQNVDTAQTNTTVTTVLLLDLFEKMTNSRRSAASELNMFKALSPLRSFVA